MSSPRIRIRIISGAIALVGILFIGKLFLLQVVHGSDFREEASQQYTAPTSNVYNRGTIFFQDKDGNLLDAAALQTGYIMSINPGLVIDPEGEYAKINGIMPLDHSTFIQKATKQHDVYEQIADRVSATTSAAITALNLPGVSFYQEKWRAYPLNTLAAQVIGFAGYDGDVIDGRYGLEKYYDNVLDRTDQEKNSNPFIALFANLPAASSSDSADKDGDIVSTIDPNVESELEQQLQTIQDTYHSKISGGIIIDPNTGAIYAMAGNPTYDPNNYQDVNDIGVYNDPLVQNVYELGSIMKSITMAIGLDTGAVTPSTTYDDTASITLNGKTIHNWDLVGHGVISMQKVLSDSLNVGAAWVENKTGNQQFANYMFNFGFGEKTGIDLPNEATNLVANLKSAQDVNYATAAFGQGVAVTPISMVRALSVLANGGTLVKPYVISEIQYSDGSVQNLAPTTTGPRVISQNTSKEITQMLINVVDQALDADVGGGFKMAHYSIAAKTGTAQLVDLQDGGYYSNRFLHSFFGYFPANNPRFLVFLYTDDPQGQELAVHTLAWPFHNIVKFMIGYYNVPPDR